MPWLKKNTMRKTYFGERKSYLQVSHETNCFHMSSSLPVSSMSSLELLNICIHYDHN
uniref:Uncharacterized protein n=1 Tax=Rhizophora mucronata TaxID=61149 RepID=A0A2P2NS89_RHIMU